MLLAVYQQRLDPLAGKVAWSSVWSTACSPPCRCWCCSGCWCRGAGWRPRRATAAALTAFVVAITVYGMPADMAGMAFVHGAAFGLLPVGWTIFNAMLLYNITVETGQFDIVRRSVAGLSGDARIQAILIGFAFGAFLEGAAGGGTPVAICGAIMVGLGFDPFQAAVLCLIANTSPVAYGGLGTPIITLTGVTGIDGETLSIMAGHQLPFLSLLVPLYMVRCMCPWRQTLEVWPALLVAGGSFAAFSSCSPPCTPTAGPRPLPDDRHRRRHLLAGRDGDLPAVLEAATTNGTSTSRRRRPADGGQHGAAIPTPREAAAAAAWSRRPPTDEQVPLTARQRHAWPGCRSRIMSVLLLLTGIVRQTETASEPVQADTVSARSRRIT